MEGQGWTINMTNGKLFRILEGNQCYGSKASWEGCHSFSWGSQEVFTEEVIYEQRLERGERWSLVNTKERAFCIGNGQCKGPGAKHAWNIGRRAMKSLWLD